MANVDENLYKCKYVHATMIQQTLSGMHRKVRSQHYRIRTCPRVIEFRQDAVVTGVGAGAELSAMDVEGRGVSSIRLSAKGPSRGMAWMFSA